jgi:UDP-N-acetyl-D-mannosaminuronic acid dehydrogenase
MRLKLPTSLPLLGHLWNHHRVQNVVIVGGGGHVGLPFALVLASSGYKVCSLDISHETVDLINSGVMPFKENGAPDLLVNALAAGTFKATTEHSVVAEADVLIVVIGTPVDEHMNPDPNAVGDAISACIPHMNSSQLVVLRSTVFPGVTAKVKTIFESFDLHPEITFCPERILEGDAIKELRELPQIVGAWNASAANRASSFFSKLGIETIVVTPEEAELAKLFTNVWRYIKFAAANQFWLMSNEAGLDFSKIRKALGFLESVKFNFEKGEKSSLKGNATDKVAKGIWGKDWIHLDLNQAWFFWR